MTAQTAPPTTRQLANRLRSALEWLDSNGDVLPGNWNLDMHASGRLEIGWHRGKNDMARVATTLLAQGRPVSLVAHRCGYSTTSAFSAAFRRVTGTSRCRSRCRRSSSRPTPRSHVG